MLKKNPKKKQPVATAKKTVKTVKVKAAKKVAKATKGMAKTRGALEPIWRRCFNEIWNRLREHRTKGPITVLDTKFSHVDDNFGQFKGYTLQIRVTSGVYGKYPVNYVAAILKNNRTLVAIHHLDGLELGTEVAAGRLLDEFGDTGFKPDF